ncbi:hypothetical protein M9H77_30268 [Catharanthus roseus]|uniref:Uncharacterized protein n=1 Tax=Catharanthus roseus TaxID=4058 RepID=A0ACB9ZX54_CATRO|nr:hypothetical protein M9H77_30268 [Catharanthus roseus]
MCLIMPTDGQLPIQSHQEGTSDPTRINLNETLRSTPQAIEGLARQFQSVARDIEELKKGNISATMEQRVGDNLGGFNSPHHQRPFDNVSTYGYKDMPSKNSHPFHEGGYKGRPQVRGRRRKGSRGKRIHRPQETYPRDNSWHEDNWYEDFGDNSNVGQVYHGGYYGIPKKEDIHKVASKDHSKPKMEEKGRLITNPQDASSAMEWAYCYKLSYQENIDV